MPLCERLFFPDEISYRVEVPGVGPSANDRLHHMARYRANKKLKDDARCAAQSAVIARQGKPLAAARIDIMLVRKRHVQPKDRDNALGCCKAVVDGVVASGLIRDDGPLYIEYGAIEQSVGPVPMTILTLTEIQPRIT